MPAKCLKSNLPFQGMNGVVRDEILLQLTVPIMFVQVPTLLAQWHSSYFINFLVCLNLWDYL